MGELLDQIISGGPELLPLPDDSAIVDTLTSMRDHGGEWAFYLRGSLTSLRAALLAEPPRITVDGHFINYDELVVWISRERFGERELRTLMVWLGCGFGFAFGPLGFYETFRAWVAAAATEDDKHREIRTRVMSADAAPWDMRPSQCLRRLAAVRVS